VCVCDCSTYYKAVRGEGDSHGGGHVLRETTSRGLCGLVCPSRTSERGGKGDSSCVNEGGEELASESESGRTESRSRPVCVCVCVFITAGPSTKLCAWGGGGYWGTFATRGDEPRPVWTSLPITH
jgi:hypothetical protein